MKTIKILPGCLCLLIFVLLGCSTEKHKEDVEFAKTAVTTLHRGDSAVESLIDWEAFQMYGENVGMLYLMMPDEKEKSDFRRSFVAQFSTSFQSTGASADRIFTNWRIQDQDSARTIVAADRPDNTTLLVFVSKRDGKQRISGLQLTTSGR